MPIQVYDCDVCGCQDVFFKTPGVYSEWPCPKCGKPAKHRISAPAIIDIRRDWNDNASDMQRNPYEQSKAQLTNMNRTAAGRGEPLVKITEEAIQAGAKAIHEQKVNPTPDPEDRHIAKARSDLKKSKKEKADRAAGKIE